MRNMSFSSTKRQLLDGTKTVTRRLGWAFLKPGDRVCAVCKATGREKGGKIKRLAELEIMSVRQESLEGFLDYYDNSREISREGFPAKTWPWFVSMFCREMRCAPDDTVTRIEFRVVRRLTP